MSMPYAAPSDLHSAVRSGNTDNVRLFLEGGADVDEIGDNGKTPLYEAVRCGYIEIAQLLIDNGANVNAKDKRSWTPLHEASHWGYAKIVQLLLDNGADIYAKTNKGETALDIAKRQGRTEIAKILESTMEKTEDPATDTQPASDNDLKTHHYRIKQALHEGNEEEARRLMDEGCDINFSDHNGNTFLHHSVGDADQLIVEYIISKGADVNAKNHAGDTPLHYTAYSDSIRASSNAQSLLRNGADTSIRNDRGETVLDIAKKYDRVAHLLILPSEETEPTSDTNTQTTYKPTFSAHMLRCIETGQTEMLRSLLEAVSRTPYKILFSVLLEKSIDEADRDAFEVVLSYAIREYRLRNEPDYKFSLEYTSTL